MRNLLLAALLFLTFIGSAIADDNEVCGKTFINKAACENWFAAQGMMGSPFEKVCCDKAPDTAAICDKTFINKTACENWFAAQGMMGSPYETLCCSKLK